MSISPSINNYLNLIPSPNFLMPNFMAWLQANLQPYIDQQNCVNSIIQAFVLSTAVGIQLDILGQIIGVARQVNFVPSLSTDSPILSDANYRIVLLAQILKNTWRGTVGEIYSFFQIFLPGQPVFIQDNQDMSMTVWAIGLALGIQQDLMTHNYIIPKPAGVRISFVFGNPPFFGFDTENTYIQGLDQGKWFNFTGGF